MKFTVGAVRFNEDGSAACQITTSTSPHETFLNELCFWACFANRQFNNMGPDGVRLGDRLMSLIHRFDEYEFRRICACLCMAGANGDIEVVAVFHAVQIKDKSWVHVQNLLQIGGPLFVRGAPLPLPTP